MTVEEPQFLTFFAVRDMLVALMGYLDSFMMYPTAGSHMDILILNYLHPHSPLPLTRFQFSIKLYYTQ